MKKLTRKNQAGNKRTKTEEPWEEADPDIEELILWAQLNFLFVDTGDYYGNKTNLVRVPN